MRNLIKAAFIDPLASPTLLRVYIATILGTIGFQGTNLYFAFDYAALGVVPLTVFFCVRFITSGFLLFPLLFKLLEKLPGKTFFIFIVIFQILSITGTFFVDRLSDSFQTGAMAFLIGAVAVPFWVSFHSMMLRHTTHKNRGNEVSIAQLGNYIGTTIGALIAGIALVYLPQSLFILISFSAILMATILLLSLLVWKDKEWNQVRKEIGGTGIIHAIFRKPRRTANTIMQGTHNFTSNFFAPVWLKFLSLGGLAVGIIIAAKLILNFAISPLAGHWANQNHGRESKWGAFLNILGWGPWIFIHSPWLLIYSSLFWGVGGHMFKIGLNSRWYADKTLDGVAAREFCLAIGRILTALIAIPLLYTSMTGFFIFAFALSALMFVTSFLESRDLRNTI